MCRLPEDAPVRVAYDEANRPLKKNIGGQRLTWPKVIEKDLKDSSTNISQAQILAQDRQGWRTFTSRLVYS